MSATPKLLPCPFCGDTNPQLSDGLDDWWSVACPACAACGPQHGDESATMEENKAAAVRGWNAALRPVVVQSRERKLWPASITTKPAADAEAQRRWGRMNGLAVVEKRGSGACPVCKSEACSRRRVMAVGQFEPIGPGPGNGLHFVAKGRGHSWGEAFDQASRSQPPAQGT